MRRLLRWLGRLLLVLVIGLAVFAGGALFMRSVIAASNRSAGAIVSPRGIAEARFVSIGGVRQWISIRGQDRDKPVLLYLHGGPLAATIDVLYATTQPWEDEVVVVQWDQRGAGRSIIDKDRLKGTITVERNVADTIEMLEMLNRRFGKKVIVLGQSWGSVLGAEVAHRRPDLVAAYVGVGQVTGWEEIFTEARRLLIGEARAAGRTAELAELLAMPPQPSARRDFAGQQAWIKPIQRYVAQYGHSWHNNISSPDWTVPLLGTMLASPTVSSGDLVALVYNGLRDDGSAHEEIIRSLSGWRAETNAGTNFQVPIIIMAGSHDWQTPVTLASAYFKSICAPSKAWVAFPNSAHIVITEEPGRFQRALIEQILPAAAGQVPPGAEVCAAPR